MPSTATIQISGSFSGLPEGSALPSITITNSTSVGLTAQTTFSSGIGAASTGVLVPAHARYALIVSMVDSSTIPFYICGSSGATTATALRLASSGVALLPVISTVAMSLSTGTKLFFFSSGAQFASSALRVTFF